MRAHHDEFKKPLQLPEVLTLSLSLPPCLTLFLCLPLSLSHSLFVCLALSPALSLYLSLPLHSLYLSLTSSLTPLKHAPSQSFRTIGFLRQSPQGQNNHTWASGMEIPQSYPVCHSPRCYGTRSHNKSRKPLLHTPSKCERHKHQGVVKPALLATAAPTTRRRLGSRLDVRKAGVAQGLKDAGGVAVQEPQ